MSNGSEERTTSGPSDVEWILAELRRRGVHLRRDGEELELRAPRGALTGDLLALARKSKAALLDELGREDLVDGGFARDTATTHGSLAPAPLSFTQERLWFLDRLDQGSAHYVMTCVFRVRGAVDEAALGRAFDALVERHASLRTTFAEGTSGPIQRTHEARGDVLEIESAEAIDEASLVARAAREAARVTDLENGPLFRALLLRRSVDDVALVLSMHHVVGDAWSLAVMTQDLSVLYDAARAGVPFVLAPLELQYVDFARGQRDPSSADRVARDIAFWTRELAGIPAELDLPADRARPPAPTFRGEAVTFTVPFTVARALRELSRTCNATLFATLLAAFGLFLGRHAGQQDVVVGAPSAGRTRVELERLIGFFANTLPLRITYSEDITFRDLVLATHDRVARSLEHQDVPFAALVRALALSRDRSRTPIFQVMFSFENMPEIGVTLGEASVSAVAVPPDSAKFDLTLVLREAGSELTALFEYATDLFDRATVERMRDRFLTLLEELVRAPQRRLAEISMLPASERCFLESVEYGGDAAARAPKGETVFSLFRRHAMTAPDAVAILFGDECVTYGELLQRSSVVASRLIALGLDAGESVALCLERSATYVAAILGVWQAGGCYVPIDPAAPAERVRAIVGDAASRIGIHQGARRSKIEGVEHAIELTPASFDAPPGANTNFGTTPSPRSRAYVMYTSGSTGAPKGVAVHHEALVSLAAATRERVFARGERRLVVALVSSFHFDASVEGLVRLADGDTLVLVSEEERIDPNATADLVRRHRVDVLDSSPALLRLLLEALSPDRLPPTITVGNEAIDPALWAQARALPATRVVNVYGPTETTVEVTAADLADADVPVIGRPLPGCRCYVLDEQLRRVPVGAAGELCVGGAQVALGYLGRPVETEAKFVDDPFAPEPGATMFKTGDRARWREDGNIEYLGRIDRQIKIRGYRIEPGEIESALRAHPSVRDAAVEAHELERGDKRLVAYVTLEASSEPGPEALRTHLRARIPEYMIPTHFVALAALPLTPAGKIDRRALPLPPEPGRSGDASASLDGVPRTERERRLARIWADLLGVARVGVHDNFFELGGHSLLAAEMVSRVRRELDPGFALRTLFERPTVAELSALVSSATAAGEPTLVRLNGCRSGTPIVFVHPLSGDVTCYRQVASLVRTHPVLAIRSGALDGAGQTPSSLDELAGRYARAIHSEIEGGFVLAGWSAGGLFAHATARACLASARHDVLGLTLIDSFLLADRADDGGRGYLIELLLERGSVEEARAAEACDPSEIPSRLGSALGVIESEARTLLAVYGEHARLLARYRPAPIGVPVRCLRASSTTSNEPRWGESERSIAVRGDHFGCIREHAADVAAELFETAASTDLQ